MERIKLIKGDITRLKIDAIVNAANSSLLSGGGVDGAIHRAAGPELLVECRALDGCRVGQAKITKGYNLSSRWVIHTVGPVWHGGRSGEDKLLTDCYKNSLQLSVDNNIKTIAFPCISTGVYRFPKERAAKIAVTQTREFLENNKAIDGVTFVCFDQEDFKLYENLLNLDK